jgi:chromosome segregation ATPase
LTKVNEDSNIEAFIPSLQALQHALNEIEVLCARLNRNLRKKKEKIINLKIDLRKTQKCQIKARSDARARKLEAKYSRLMRVLHRTENEKDALRNRLDKAKAEQHKLRQQLTKTRQKASKMSNRLVARSQSATALQGRGNRSTSSGRVSSNEPRIYIVRSREYTQLDRANGVHRVWR